MRLPRLRHIEFLILKTLVNRPKTRAEIQKELRWDFSVEYFYNTMNTLINKGYITKTWMVQENPFRYFLAYEMKNGTIKILKESKEFYS